jgi:nucleoid DNA-binding protein
MGPADITRGVKNRTGVPYELAWPIVQEFIAELADQLDYGQEVRLPGIGTFKWVQEKPRSGVSIITGKRWHHNAKKRLRWYPSHRLRGGRDG